ncbi:oxidoreductase [Ilyonectria robusta]
MATALSSQPQSWDNSVNDRLGLISDKLDENPEFRDESVPGLKELLDDYTSDNVAKDDFHRRLLEVFKRSTTDETYSQVLGDLTQTERDKVNAFVEQEKTPEELGRDFVLEPSPGCRDELCKLEQAEAAVHVSSTGSIDLLKGDGPSGAAAMSLMSTTTTAQKSAPAHGGFLKGIFEDIHNLFFDKEDDKGALVYYNAPFNNWGLTINNTPSITYVPTTVSSIQKIVKLAKEKKMSVRCSGYRHSWSPIFGRQGQIMISMLGIALVTRLPNTAALPFSLSKPTELEVIEPAPGKPRVPENKLVRIGCAATNERLRRWCISNKTVTIPLNVIMVEITLGGSNAPICHGAGRRNMTLSDLVRKIEYVDANGEIQYVDNPDHLRAASGCFGLMGVVTHITMEFPPMTYAQLAPKKMPVIRAVPPPPGLAEKDIPPALFKDWKNLSPKEQHDCQAEFERRATNDYYAEWFWFPYSDFSWVNTWDNTTDSKGVQAFPDNTHIFLSFIQTVTMNVLQNAKILNDLIQVTQMSEAAVTLISRAAMAALPEKSVKTWLPDALHFQRAIQNVRVRDVEVEMPLVAKKGGPAGTIDFAPVQQAWWDAILLCYENRKKCPMRMPLEMRIMGGSDVVMAPQRGNALGTCSIEVLTLHNAANLWPTFAQSVLDKWMALKDPNTGKLLKTRPHWAKEWVGYTVNGKPWIQKLKEEDYKDERQEFLRILAEIGQGVKVKWTLQDLKDRFSNDLFDELFFDQVGNKTGQNGNVVGGKH